MFNNSYLKRESWRHERQGGRVTGASVSQSGGPGFDRAPLLSLAGIVLGLPQFRSLAKLVKPTGIASYH